MYLIKSVARVGKKSSTLLLKAVLDLDISTQPNLLVQNSCHFSVDSSQTVVPILHLKHASRPRERMQQDVHPHSLQWLSGYEFFSALCMIYSFL